MFLLAAKAAQHALLYAMMWHTGLRHADVSKVLIQSIQMVTNLAPHPEPFHEWYLHVGLTKTSKQSGIKRVLRIHDDGSAASLQACLSILRQCLRSMSLELRDGYIFAAITCRDGYPRLGPDPATYKTAENYFDMVKDLTGVPAGVKLHSFHGSKAALDLARGASTEDICEDMDWTMGTLHEYLDGRIPITMPVEVKG